MINRQGLLAVVGIIVGAAGFVGWNYYAEHSKRVLFLAERAACREMAEQLLAPGATRAEGDHDIARLRLDVHECLRDGRLRPGYFSHSWM